MLKLFVQRYIHFFLVVFIFLKDHIQANKPILLANLNEAFNLIKASITIVYPEGLPEYDPTREILDGNYSFDASSVKTLTFLYF